MVIVKILDLLDSKVWDLFLLSVAAPLLGLVALMVTIISLWALIRWLKLSRRLRA